MKKLVMKKLVYDLGFIKKEFNGIENMPILQNKSFSYSVRGLPYRSASTVEFYDRKHKFLGQDASCMGPYGDSDFWTYDDKGKVCPIDTPDVDFSVFEDRLFNVIVVRAWKGE